MGVIPVGDEVLKIKMSKDRMYTYRLGSPALQHNVITSDRPSDTVQRLDRLGSGGQSLSYIVLEGWTT